MAERLLPSSEGSVASRETKSLLEGDDGGVGGLGDPANVGSVAGDHGHVRVWAGVVLDGSAEVGVGNGNAIAVDESRRVVGAVGVERVVGDPEPVDERGGG